MKIISWVKRLDFYVAQRLFLILRWKKLTLFGKNELTNIVNKWLNIVFIIMDPSEVIFSLRVDHFHNKLQKWWKLWFRVSQFFRKILNDMRNNFHGFKSNFIRSFMTKLKKKILRWWLHSSQLHPPSDNKIPTALGNF